MKLQQIWKLLEGKKTYLAAAALVIVSATGLYCGALSDAQSLAVFSAAFGFIGLGDKADRAARMLEAFIEEQKAKGK